jgi:hypothetical protein
LTLCKAQDSMGLARILDLWCLDLVVTQVQDNYHQGRTHLYRLNYICRLKLLISLHLSRCLKVFREPTIFLSGKGYLSLIQCYQTNYSTSPSFIGYKYTMRALTNGEVHNLKLSTTFIFDKILYLPLEDQKFLQLGLFFL